MIKKNIAVMILLWAIGFRAHAPAGIAAPQDDVPPLLTSAEWLAAVRARLPQQPAWITGRLSTDGQPMLNLDILLQLGHEPPVARYTLSDAFGRDLKEITMWRETDKIRVRYRRGERMEEEETPPELFAPIRQTAMSWGDLSLSFLWWTNGEVIGYDEVRGRECVVLELAAPDEEAGTYDHVRLWIDRQHRMLLQAEGYDARGNRVRRMQVRSFRKIGDDWMVKDIVVRLYPGTLRTNFRVRDMGELPDAG